MAKNRNIKRVRRKAGTVVSIVIDRPLTAHELEVCMKKLRGAMDSILSKHVQPTKSGRTRLAIHGGVAWTDRDLGDILTGAYLSSASLSRSGGAAIDAADLDLPQ
jgi:hypothetical protein